MGIDELYLLALTFGLGLLGFVEPCSLEAYRSFLGYLREKDRTVRLLEALKFSLGRSTVLGLFGLGIAFLGGLIFPVQKGLWSFLGLQIAVPPK